MDVGVYPKGRNIFVTGGRRCFGHKLRNELKNTHHTPLLSFLSN